MADNQIEVEIVLDDGSIQKGFAKLKTEGNKTADSLSRKFRRVATADISRPFDTVKRNIFNLRNAIVGIGAALAGIVSVREIIQAASVQQDAINQLNTSLQTAGTFSAEASQRFQDLASSLQANSTIGDEVILQQAALARNYARSNEEAERLIATSIDLSAATGISLDSAVRNLGKTLSGLTGELGEAVPQVRGLTAEQLRAGAAIDVLAERFGGAALAQTRTFSGALAQLRNVFGDFLEGVGRTFTESKVIVNAFNAISQTFVNLNSNLSKTDQNFDQFFKNQINNVFAFAKATVETAKIVAEAPTFIEFAFVGLGQTLSRLFANINSLIGRVQKSFFEFIGDTRGASRAQRRIDLATSSIFKLNLELERIAGGGVDLQKRFAGVNQILDSVSTRFAELNTKSVELSANLQNNAGAAGEALTPELIRLRDQVQTLQAETLDAIFDAYVNPVDVLKSTETVFETLSDKSVEALKKLAAELANLKNTTVQQTNQISQAIQNGIANSISKGVQAAVNGLIKGQNAFEAFGKALLAVFGDLAIQLGGFFILLGLAKLLVANPFSSAAGLIAAGAALVALGTLLKAISGEGATNVAAGSSTAPPLANVDGDGTDTTSDLNGPNQTAQVIIQGDVFDTEETGLRIADILKDQGFNNAVIA